MSSLNFGRSREMVAKDAQEGMATPCGSLRVTSIYPIVGWYCWHCDLVKMRRRAFVGHGGLRYADVYPVTAEDATVRKPEARKEEAVGVEVMAENCPVLGTRPKISEYLVTTAYEDGSPRKQSTLKVSFEGGKVKIALDDHDLKQSLYTVGDNFIECLDMMESALQSEQARFYVWGGHKNRKK